MRLSSETPARRQGLVGDWLSKWFRLALGGKLESGLGSDLLACPPCRVSQGVMTESAPRWFGCLGAKRAVPVQCEVPHAPILVRGQECAVLPFENY